MTTIREGDLLWTPSKARRDRSQVLRFMQWLKEHRGLELESYDALWRWSVTDLDSFWHSIWEYFGIPASAPSGAAADPTSAPRACWSASGSWHPRSFFTSMPTSTAVSATTAVRSC